MSHKHRLRESGLASIRSIGLLCMLIIFCGCETNRTANSWDLGEADALAEFEDGANRPPSAQTLYRMAKILESQGKDRQAESVLRSTIERYPTFSPAYRALAEIQIRKRWLNEAITTLQTGIAVAPDDPVLANDLGMAYLLNGEPAAGLVEFERAHALSDKNARYVSNMAMATALQGDYDRSVELYQEVVPPAIAHYNVAVLCEANGEHDRAAAEYAHAMQIDPQYRSKLRNRK